MRQGTALALLGVLILVLSAALAPAFAQSLSASEVKAYKERAAAFFEKDRYGEALAVAEKWAKAAEKAEGKNPGAGTAEALGNAAWYALFAKRASRALAASERAMALNPGALWIETNRAHALFFQGRFEKAAAAYAAHKGETMGDGSKWEETILKDFAEFRKHGLGHAPFRRMEEALAAAPDSPEVLHQTADKLAKEGKYAEAIPFAERYLAEMKSRHGENHAKYAGALDRLGSRLKDAGRGAEAEPLYKQALAIRERVLGQTDMWTLVTVNNLGLLYRDLGRYPEAESLLKRALEGDARTRGPDSALASADNLATVYKDQGRYAEAEVLRKRVLDGYERTLGKEHPRTLTAINNLAVLYSELGRYAEAEALDKGVLEVRERTLGKDHPDTLASVNNLAYQCYAQGRYAEAEKLYRRGLEAFERTLGKDHPSTLNLMGNLASVLNDQGRYAEAEPLYKRSLEGSERVLGPDHPRTLTRANNLAVLYREVGRYAESVQLLRRVLEARKGALGEDHPDTLSGFSNLATVLNDQARYAEVERLHKHVLEVRERVLGADHPDTLVSVINLAGFYQNMGRFAEAEPLSRRALEASVRKLGPEHPGSLTAVANLGALYESQGRYAEAEPLHWRALEGSERALGKDHPDTLTRAGNLAYLFLKKGELAEAEALFKRALESLERVAGKDARQTLTTVNNLAIVYDDEQRYSEAEGLNRRALEGRERTLGRDHPDTLVSVNNLGVLYWNLEKYADAEPMYLRGLEASERIQGKDHPDTLIGVINLASLYDSMGRYSEAEGLFQRALETSGRVLGPDHPTTLAAVYNFGGLYQHWGRYAQAEPFLRQALDGRERLFGPGNRLTLLSAGRLAALAFEQGDFVRAVELGRRTTAEYAQLTLRGALKSGAAKRKTEAEQQSKQFWQLVKGAYRLAPEGTAPDAALTGEMFETAQWALSSDAAQSLTQMAARGAAANPELAALARERQDLVLEWQKRDQLRDAALAKPAEKRDAAGEAENAARLAAIDTRLAETDTRLKSDFPDFAALTSPAPLPLAEAQALLNENEALVLFLDTPDKKPTPEETFIWVVTKKGARWLRSELGKAALAREVQALRCGLDGTAWRGPSCAELTGQQYSEADAEARKPLPFDAARAHGLYKALFGQAGDLIEGKQLLLAPSGALTQLPFQVLVTEEPKDGAQPAWLIRDHALTVLPAVSSLKALRRLARTRKAEKPMTGFGNPLLDGPDERYAELAEEARRNVSCTASQEPRKAASVRVLGGSVPQLVTRAGLVDAALLRKAPPLPETAGELCAVAADLGAAPDAVYLGARATEAQVKRMSGTGELAQYRILHFATHGALAGQVSGLAEPGLLMTPPETPSEEDDGYLSASEIAGLKLDADLAILSACNTAAGGAQGAEALSGLARAFIYAQARALLVSHWEVDSATTVKLVTGAMSRLAADKSMGRAEAMRQSMLALISEGTAQEAHPAYWAPFVVVGEGGAGR